MNGAPPMRPAGQFLVRKGATRPFARDVAGVITELAADGSSEFTIALSILAVPLLRAAERRAKLARRRYVIPVDVTEALAELGTRIGLEPREITDLHARVIAWTFEARPTSYQRDAEGRR